ncbi:MAG: chemotaxis protein CheX [Planctomycetes bacterium]|nr:chemotaxis protein CheX [Planctomycetota bacterium]
METKESILASVIQEVFETMAFEVAVSPEDAPPDEGSHVQASLSFEGPLCGRVHLRLPRSSIPALAAQILGREDGNPIPEAEALDALCELTNVMGGNLLAAVAGPQAVFDLHPPTIEPDAPPAERSREGLSVDVARIPFAWGWASVYLVVDRSPAPRGVSVSGGAGLAEARRERE